MEQTPVPPTTELLQPLSFQTWQLRRQQRAAELYTLSRTEEENHRKQRQQLEEAWNKAVKHASA